MSGDTECRKEISSPARKLAVEILLKWDKKRSYINLLLSAILSRSNLSQQDRAFVSELVYGTIKFKLTLDWAISQVSRLSFSQIEPEVAWALRVGAYQLFFTRVPAYAAINETVSAVKSLANPGAGKFVNAVLRKLAETNPLENIESDDRVEYLTVKYSHPRWLVEKWLSEFSSLEEVEKLLQSNNQSPPLSLRVNTLKISLEELEKLLEKRGLSFKRGRFSLDCLYIENWRGNLEKLEEFKKGYFYLQDEASMVVSEVLSPQPGERILDVCAAPGGKTTHLAQLMKDEGEIVAVDVNHSRLKLVLENASRLGIKSIVTVERDARELDFPQGSFDAILVDAPCSGLGVLRRKPDIRWWKSKEDIPRMAQLQMDILNKAGIFLKKGGRLLYSTCTIFREENEGVVKGFLEKNTDFEPKPFSIPGVNKARDFFQFLPHLH